MKIFNEELAKELEKIARPAVKNDPIAMFASDEDLLIYEHFFINGMEYNEDTISNDMTEKKTIEELAEAYADSKERRLTSYWKGLKDGYMEGAAQVDAYKARLEEEFQKFKTGNHVVGIYYLIELIYKL